MKVLTTRSCNVKEYYIQMEVGWERNRGDVIAYAKLAKELGGLLTINDVQKYLLGPCNASIISSILDCCVQNDIFQWESDESVKLTRSGLQCAENERYFERDLDLFHIRLLDDPHAPFRLIRCNPVRSTDHRLGSDVAFGEVPNRLRTEIEGCVFENVYQKRVNSESVTVSERGKVFSIVDRCIELDDHDSIEVEGEISEQHPLTEKIRDFNHIFWPRPEIDLHTFLCRFRKEHPERCTWDDSYNRFRTAFPASPTIKIESGFRGGITFSDIRLEEIFGNTPVKNINFLDCPLMPATLEDAQRWYYHLIEEEILDYLSEDDLRSILERTRESFKDFKTYFHRIISPNRGQFIEYIRANSSTLTQKYWYLQAPEDLSLAVNE